MVNQRIKVYARVRRRLKENAMVPYDITTNKENFEDLTFYLQSSYNISNICGFRFHKVFNINSSQEDIFNTIAVPVINSVVEGFNGTIFAYGQTGSGKTYTMTGSASSYEERGIIPRTIQYIYKHYENMSEKPTIYISYMEIYNEIGYDLLSTNQPKNTKLLDHFSRILLLEDKNGEAHIRNLQIFPVNTEQDAMRLLFLGDKNRTIAETTSNEFSSRSHCIFTLYINFRDPNSSYIRSSKLHIVDLAGSERLSKTNIKGQRIREAKSINLSLHYLQHVILALSESKRKHIPYRNSLLTHILRDSLNGNSITTMLAALSAEKLNIDETISTCRFAQRVATITTYPVINVLDPQREIAFLKLKIEDLEKQLAQSKGFVDSKSLDTPKMEECVEKIKSFVGSSQETINIEPDMTQIQFCFKLLKKELENKKKECIQLENSLNKNSEISEFTGDLHTKEKEISNLKELVNCIPENRKFSNTKTPLISNLQQTDYIPDVHKPHNNYSDTTKEKHSNNSLISNSDVPKTLSYYKKELEKRLDMAKDYANSIGIYKKRITDIKQKLDTPLSETEKSELLRELESEQKLYAETLDKLFNLQKETISIQGELKQAECKFQKSKNNVPFLLCWNECTKTSSSTDEEVIHPDPSLDGNDSNEIMHPCNSEVSCISTCRKHVNSVISVISDSRFKKKDENISLLDASKRSSSTKHRTSQLEIKSSNRSVRSNHQNSVEVIMQNTDLYHARSNSDAEQNFSDTSKYTGKEENVNISPENVCRPDNCSNKCCSCALEETNVYRIGSHQSVPPVNIKQKSNTSNYTSSKNNSNIPSINASTKDFSTYNTSTSRLQNHIGSHQDDPPVYIRQKSSNISNYTPSVSINDSTKDFSRYNTSTSRLQRYMKMCDSKECINSGKPCSSNSNILECEYAASWNDFANCKTKNYDRPQKDNASLANNAYVLPEDLVATKDPGFAVSAEDKENSTKTKESALLTGSKMKISSDESVKASISSTSTILSVSVKSFESAKASTSTIVNAPDKSVESTKPSTSTIVNVPDKSVASTKASTSAIVNVPDKSIASIKAITSTIVNVPDKSIESTKPSTSTIVNGSDKSDKSVTSTKLGTSTIVNASDKSVKSTKPSTSATANVSDKSVKCTKPTNCTFVSVSKAECSSNENNSKKQILKEADETNKGIDSYFLETDTVEFKDFMKTIILTGSEDVDREIFNFYRDKFCTC